MSIRMCIQVKSRIAANIQGAARHSVILAVSLGIAEPIWETVLQVRRPEMREDIHEADDSNAAYANPRSQLGTRSESVSLGNFSFNVTLTSFVLQEIQLQGKET
jgi:hypothetical protein